MSHGMSQTSHCSNITTMEFLRHSTARVGCYFLLKISVLKAKGISKNVPNLEVCENTPDPPIKQSKCMIIWTHRRAKEKKGAS